MADLKILSIDAWRDPEGWSWNDHRKVGTVTMATVLALDTPRKVARFLRAEGYLTPASAGKIRVDMGDCYVEETLIEIQDKGTGEPLIAISAIH